MHLWYTQMKYYRIRFALWIIFIQKLFWDMTLFADSVINLSGGLFVFVLFQNVIELSIYPFNNQSSTFNTYSNNIIMNCNLIIYRYIIYIYIYYDTIPVAFTHIVQLTMNTTWTPIKVILRKIFAPIAWLHYTKESPRSRKYNSFRNLNTFAFINVYD